MNVHCDGNGAADAADSGRVCTMSDKFDARGTGFSRPLAGLTALVFAFGAATVAHAQQQKAPAAKAPAAQQPAPQPAPQAAAPAAGGGAPQSAWVKLCEKAPIVSRDKDNKEIKQDKNICLTHHERLDGSTGLVLVSAAIRQVEGAPKQHLMVMVPLGMAIPPGMRAAVYSKEFWEKAQKNEKIDETKLKPVKLDYTLCHPAGCTAEIEATAELVNEMKTGGGLMVFAVNATGQPIAFPVPLVGFDQAIAGAPVDNQKYSEARQQLFAQIAQRQQENMEQYKKQQEELAKMQKSGQAPAQPAAPAKK